MVLKEWRVERGEKKQLVSVRRHEYNRKKFMMEKLRVERGAIFGNASVIHDLPVAPILCSQHTSLNIFGE